MHQPYYKHPKEDHYILPWVRLHGVKDYYGMAKMVEKFDTVKVAVNFSGVLLYQLLDYVRNNAQDYYGILSLKDPVYLKKEEKNFIIDRFFSVNFERFIRPNRRYLQLYNKKLSARAAFGIKDIEDLQVLFNLCWFHPYTIKEDKHLRALIRKEKNYTLEDRKYVLKKQYEILSKIIPLYKNLLSKGKIEVTVSPFHHPILPLIYDTDILKAFSYLKAPSLRFSSPADCSWHLRRAKDVCKDAFGYIPQGSWPSEGSVSEDVISLYGNEGFKWVGADEAILFKSLTTEYVSYDLIKNQRHLLYKPFKFKDVHLFFRDRNLSDAISFIYQGWDDSVFAANDLLEHFRRIHEYAKNMVKERSITIIMDGENAWEYYKNNGVDFLETVYAGLEKSDIFSMATPHEFLKCSGERKLERLACGSWINGDFGVWVGNQKNNEYWYMLRRIKDLFGMQRIGKINYEKAKESLYLLEGSDWYWWNTFEDVIGEFKNIFYLYVNEIYRLFKKKVPSYVTKAVGKKQ